MHTTEVYVQEPGKVAQRINKIDAFSRFKSINTKSLDLSLPGDQRQVADDIIWGWRMNGPYPMGTKFFVKQNGELV